MNEQMREALKQTTELLAEYLRDAGGCDHSVGICYCNDFRVLEEAQAALARQSEAQPVAWNHHFVYEDGEKEEVLSHSQNVPAIMGAEYAGLSEPLFTAPPSAKAIETAALMKAAEVCKARGDRALSAQIGSADDLSNIFLRHHAITAHDCQEAILALITPEGKTELEEFGIKCIEVALQLPEHLRIQHNLRASVKQVMEGEKE